MYYIVLTNNYIIQEKMKKKLLAIMLGSLLLASCGESRSSSTTTKTVGEFKQEWLSDKEPIDGQTLLYGVISDSPFKGVLNPLLYTDAIDSAFLSPLESELLYKDEDFQIIDGGMANIKIDTENKTVTYILRDGLKWSDGEPLTVDDIIYTYEVLGSPDYTGVRYDNNLEIIKGMKEYHKGKAKKISGLKKVSDTELVVYFEELSTNLLTGTGGLVTSIVPYHYLKDIPIKDLETNTKVRLQPLSYGPYKIKQIIPGESIEYVPNEYYWNKESAPQVKSFVTKIVPTSSVLTSIKNGEYDTYSTLPSEIFEQVKALDNVELLGSPALYYSYLGFNLGKYDEKLGENVYNENAKTADINLRKALTYALNIEEISKAFFKGLRIRANGVVPPVFKKYYDETIGAFNYDPEKAKQLLDEAGYKDVDGDGIREDKNGKPFVLHYASTNGGEIAEPMATAFLQYWREIGLNVELTNGRLLDSNIFFEMVQQNSDDIDIFGAAWSVGTALDLNGVYTKKSRFNLSRISDDENERLIADVSNPDYLTAPEKRVEAFKKWHEYYMNNILGFSPLNFKIDISVVNKRIKKYSVYSGSLNNNYPMQLTETAPLKATN